MTQEQMYVCRKEGCDGEFDTERGRSIHEGRYHEGGVVPDASEEKLRRMYYEEEMSLRDIASEFGCSNTLISSWMDHYGIERRDRIDANELPISEETTFDIGWFHPPCGFVSPMSDTGSGSRDDWPNLIPLARELGETYCEDYVIENKPSEHIDEEVVLDGHMFELGIEYARAFETTFPVEQPKRQNRIADTSPFYYTEWSSGEWAACKGSTTEFSKSHLAKNTIPSAYIDYIMRHYYRHVDSEERPDYGTYDKDKKRERDGNRGMRQ